MNTAIALLGNYPREIKTYVYTKYFIHFLIEVFFLVIALNLKQPK